jgi:hypothetical protein
MFCFRSSRDFCYLRKTLLFHCSVATFLSAKPDVRTQHGPQHRKVKGPLVRELPLFNDQIVRFASIAK